MDRFFEKTPLAAAALFVLCLWLFFFQLGGLALTDPDETFYAQTAKEMLGRGEWLTPYLYGRPQFEKPIFFYWLVELSYKIFGVNEFAARFPSAVFGLIGVIVIYLLGSLLFNRRAGFLAALMLAANVEYIILSRACVTDMVLGTLIILGIYFFFLARLRGKEPYYILSSGAFGLATLTKGPIGVLLPGLIIIVYLAIVRDFGIFKKWKALLAAAAVFLAVSIPWYLAMHYLHGKEFMEIFFGFHNVTRFLQPEHEIGSQFYYYIPVVLGGFFPWSAFLPFGLWHAFKKRKGNSHPVFLLTWFFVIFTFFSASSTKLPTYIFPSFGAMALITAVLWDDFIQKGAPRGTARGMKASYHLLLCAVMAGAAGLFILIRSKYPTLLLPAAVPGLFLVFGFALSLVGFVNKKFAPALISIVYAVAIFIYPLNVLVVPELERYETSRAISFELRSLAKAGEEIGAEKDYRAGVTFYTGRMAADVDNHHLLTQFLGADGRRWCVLKVKNFHQLYDLDDKPYYTKPSYMVYRLGKKCILTNNVPDNGVYIMKKEKAR
jgi:4-amino-4-deoxy-L-arabinose transferase-like glycosyltransferase